MSDTLRADEERIVSGRAPFDSPTPSCLGRAHRRCLLDAESCSCPCHLGVEFPPPRQHAVPYVCAICHERFASDVLRAEHFGRAHPVVEEPPEPVWTPPPAKPSARRLPFRCDGCGWGFQSETGVRAHQTLEKCGRLFVQVLAFEQRIAEYEREFHDLEKKSCDEFVRPSYPLSRITP